MTRHIRVDIYPERGIMEKEQIHQEILKRVKDGRITCRRCFEIAQERAVPLKSIGEACNEKSIRITACQLGCFE